MTNTNSFRAFGPVSKATRARRTSEARPRQLVSLASASGLCSLASASGLCSVIKRVLKQSLVCAALVGCTVLVSSQPGRACQVPVFRYALEHWDPDLLEVVVLHDGSLSEHEQQLMSRLEKAMTDEVEPVNMRLTAVDKAGATADSGMEAEIIGRWGDADLPQLLAFFAPHAARPQLAWSAPLNDQNVERLLVSPTRVEVTSRLLDGQCAVWILLQSGDATADKAAEEELRRELARQPELIQLPSLTDLATEQQFDPTLNVELRVEFSLLTVGADDLAEQFFRSMLLNTEPDLHEYRKPIAIPIYGRGRTYFALVGEGITAENIADNCRFICGACSCEIKAQNPGYDLLLAANWQQVEPGNWMNSTPLPALTGIGQFEAMVDDDAEAVVQVAAVADSTGKPDLESVAAPVSGNTEALASEESAPATMLLGRMLLGWAVGLLCVGLAVTLLLRRRESS